MNNISIALVDDHVLLRNGLAGFISNLGYSVLFEADNGQDLLDKLDKENLPDIILMDISMPKMDGFAATLWMKQNYPLVNVLALSMYVDEKAIIRMLKNGAKGYILKEAGPSELKAAINAVVTKGFYYSETVTGKLVRSAKDSDDEDNEENRLLFKLNEKEIEFLKLASTEMTYKEIAERMFLSPRTIDGYRDQLFGKLDVKSRVGLVLFAIRNGIVRFN